MTPNSFKLDPPILVKDQGAFQAAIRRFNSERHLAIDSEANSLYAYQEQVCLIQISTPEEDYILDVLALDDPTPLGDTFNNPAIEKIFHASEYDILIMHEDFNFEFQNLFDTMLAAQILGKKKLGLDALLDEYLGVQVEKKYQRSNWGKRPLPTEMLKYAQVDTHFLFEIRELLDQELKEKQLSPIAKEDFIRACQVHQQPRENKKDPCWRIRGSKKLSPQKAAVLKELCKYREAAAQKMDQPVFKVLGAKNLLHIAEECPRSVPQLLNLNLPGKKNLKRHAEGLIEAVQKGLKNPPIHPPKREYVDESFLAREKALRAWRKKTANEMGVNSAVILPREILYKVVAVNPNNAAELSEVMYDVPWRLERFGDSILSILSKVD
jgi:ribonuclease D